MPPKKTPPPKPVPGAQRAPKSVRKPKTGHRWEMLGAVEIFGGN